MLIDTGIVDNHVTPTGEYLITIFSNDGNVVRIQNDTPLSAGQVDTILENVSNLSPESIARTESMAKRQDVIYIQVSCGRKANEDVVVRNVSVNTNISDNDKLGAILKEAARKFNTTFGWR